MQWDTLESSEWMQPIGIPRSSANATSSLVSILFYHAIPSHHQSSLSGLYLYVPEGEDENPSSGHEKISGSTDRLSRYEPYVDDSGLVRNGRSGSAICPGSYSRLSVHQSFVWLTGRLVFLAEVVAYLPIAYLWSHWQQMRGDRSLLHRLSICVF